MDAEVDDRLNFSFYRVLMRQRHRQLRGRRHQRRRLQRICSSGFLITSRTGRLLSLANGARNARNWEGVKWKEKPEARSEKVLVLILMNVFPSFARRPSNFLSAAFSNTFLLLRERDCVGWLLLLDTYQASPLARVSSTGN